MRSSNAVLGRMLGQAGRERAATPGYGQPGYGPQGYGQPGPGFPYPTTQSQAPQVRSMTLDDVVIRTVGLLALTGAVGAISWLFLTGPVAMLAMVGSFIAVLAVALFSWVRPITNPIIIALYAVAQGVLLGMVSRVYEGKYQGIVIQAVVGTFAVFAVMAVLYKFRVIRATPRFARFIIGALIGVMAVMLVNFVLSIFGVNLGVRAGVTGEVPVLAWIFSIVVVCVAALSFILDFAMVEEGVRQGLPVKYANACAFGLLAGLIFLYWEILQLLSYFRR